MLYYYSVPYFPRLESCTDGGASIASNRGQISCSHRSIRAHLTRRHAPRRQLIKPSSIIWSRYYTLDNTLNYALPTRLFVCVGLRTLVTGPEKSESSSDVDVDSVGHVNWDIQSASAGTSVETTSLDLLRMR
jgi:hypothetical protein